jgi:hypothetical protein
MYTFNYGYMGSRTTGNDAGCSMIAGPSWEGEKPGGIDRAFRSETDVSIAIIRTQLFNPSDIDNVLKIQSGYRALPLATKGIGDRRAYARDYLLRADVAKGVRRA